ncbi:MAG TPA: UDP-2,3-diacylglucosamine diphosphatase [Syntrophorhabdaceae bacterium]|nr:UDP-2,3-diacylglucosamine diphosphatase [Syntrophorhabdaceae bacterium]HQM81676.1 UDP-2,3-diacylglucosamine diphosphatase [Syntrophorhabdaceae bacterium]
MKLIFFSDTHLTDKSLDRMRHVKDFLGNVCEDADKVFVLGDLFEFYHGYDGYIYPWYADIVGPLKRLVEKGKEVCLLEGNHEFRMGAFFQSHTGITCAQDMTIDVEGKRTYIAHGHRFDMLCLGNILQTPAIYAVMDLFGPDLTWKIAMAMGIFLSKKKKPFSAKVMEAFRGYARSKHNEGYDAVVLAHSHIPDHVSHVIGGKEKVYLNTGDFFEHGTYGEYTTSEGFQLRRYG